jgi:hypothetical protein
MLNLRVDDLDAVLEKLRAAGADIDPKREDHDYGHGAKKRPPVSPGGHFFPRVLLSSGDNEGIYDQGLDRGLGQNLRHVHVGIPAGGDVDKHHIRGIFGAGGADVKFTNGLDCHGREKEPVRYLNSCRIDQFRAHRASRFSG